jgi:hypothetical protein
MADEHLCADLIKLSTGTVSVIGNVEQISTEGCTVVLDVPIAVETPVRMQCVACPQGKKRCTECRFRGKVRAYRDAAPYGYEIQIAFEGRIWSEDEWHPRHLTSISERPAAPKRRQ